MPQLMCLVIVQDYILPNNRHATLFYHDHSVGITSENVYAGEKLDLMETPNPITAEVHMPPLCNTRLVALSEDSA